MRNRSQNQLNGAFDEAVYGSSNRTSPPLVDKIISGGQTGVDRAGLRAAMALGLPCGGWCPKGRRAEDGAIPMEFPLREMETADYPPRTEKNIQAADGTLLITRGAPEGGSLLTVRLSEKLKRPIRVVDLNRPPQLSALRAWLRKNRIQVLNVAGPRERKAPGVHDQALRFLQELLAS